MTQYKSNRLTAIIAASATVVVVMANYAVAQTADRDEMVARADANGDGDISWSEITTLRIDSFNRLDRNSDGVVNADDSPVRPFAGRFNQALERLQADFDADRNGEITKDEMLNAPAPMFEQGDVDDDGVLTAEEMAALRANTQPL